VNQSWHARRLPPRSGCFTRHWPRSTVTFFARSRSVWERKTKNLSHVPNGFLCAHLLFCILFPQLLSQGSTAVTILQAEVARVQEVIAAAEAAHAAVVLSAKTSAQEAAMAWAAQTFISSVLRTGLLWWSGRH
jgi:hypothetical protein